ncbi:hypothetical protein [Pedobacter sp. ASV12]|uniref:hypothetical protein n=1 Tax=Pedobacter sp. ASV12 TaxID=2795120 RepID=UPI0018EB5C9D|nr:hypothetical protein [Pedobacter sp. ASV12]
MKKLSNVSPFLLLLVPVFLMMVLAFATNNMGNSQDEELAAKTTGTTGNLIKAATAIVK